MNVKNIIDPVGGMAPFYIGQNVVAVDAVAGSRIKNGQNYIVTSCDYLMSPNPIANGKYFWYVGVKGSHKWLRPTIFAPIEQAFISISLKEVLNIEMQLISSN